MLRFLLHVLITVWLGFLTAVAVFSHQPESLENWKGLDTPTKPASPDVWERIEQSVLNRTTPLVITEAEANHYLAAAITGRQTGLSAHLAEFERVALHFEKNLCRLCFVWNTGGKTRTASVDFSIHREKKEYVVEPLRGHYGRLPVFRGALAALIPGMQELCGALKNEIRSVFEMNVIRIEEGRVILDPRFEATK